MSDPKTIKSAFERNRKAIELRPSIGKSTARTKVRVRNGTTCEIESGTKKLVCDVGITKDPSNNDKITNTMRFLESSSSPSAGKAYYVNVMREEVVGHL